MACGGGAFHWIAECDIIICSQDAAFFDPHVTYGMTAALEPIAAKPPAATQGSVRAIWESLDQPRTVALQTALKYCQLGNPFGTAQVDCWEIMGEAKSYETR